MIDENGICSECYITPDCTEVKCTAMPICPACDQRKAPRGRSVGAAAATSYCHCPAENDEPRAGHLWPEEWREHVAGHPKEID